MKINKLLQLLKDNARADAGQGAAAPALRAEVTQDGAHIYLYDVISSWWGASAARGDMPCTNQAPLRLASVKSST